MRQRRPGHRRGSPEWVERVKSGSLKGQARRRALLRVVSSDIAAAESGFPVRAEHRPLLKTATRRVERLLESLGGSATEQECGLLARVFELEVLLSMLFLRVLDVAPSEAADLASRIGALTGQYRALMMALGLEERRGAPVDLNEYLRKRKAGSGANGATPDAVPAPTDDRSAERDDAREADA